MCLSMKTYGLGMELLMNAQLYVISSKLYTARLRSVVLLVFTFCCLTKTQVTYVWALKAFKDFLPQASPDAILVDFATAPINALENNLQIPLRRVISFIRTQNFNKRVTEIGLKREYESNPEFNMLVKSLLERFQELTIHLFTRKCHLHPLKKDFYL